MPATDVPPELLHRPFLRDELTAYGIPPRILVVTRVDSPMETRSRLLLVFAGLPSPATGFEIIGDDGDWLATVDMAYPKSKIAIEYDGDMHRTSRRKWQYDVAARELVRRAGWEIIILTAQDIFRRPWHTLVRVHDSLVRRGEPGVPDSLDPGWEQFFAPR